MRLLILTSRLPYPPNRGDRLRVFNFIRCLSNKHEIHLISFVENDSVAQQLDTLYKYCQSISIIQLNKFQSLLTVGLNIWRKQPLQALYYRSKKMQELIDHTLVENSFDAVYVHLFRMVPYVVDHNDVYRIVDLTDVISQELTLSMPYRSWRSRLLYSIELPRIENYEQWVTRHFEEIWLISEYDRSILSSTLPDANTQVVRNGVDTHKLFPTFEPEIPDSLIFVGHMGVFHNVDTAIYLANEILPRVQSKNPNVNLKIVGNAPVQQVRALAHKRNIEITGYVADINQLLNQTSIFVAPMRFAAGVQNKVLEAMSAGRPVITSSLVNRGLCARPGRDLITADSPDETARAILYLLKNPDLRKKIGFAARKFVQERYQWDFVASRIELIKEHSTG